MPIAYRFLAFFIFTILIDYHTAMAALGSASLRTGTSNTQGSDGLDTIVIGDSHLGHQDQATQLGKSLLDGFKRDGRRAKVIAASGTGIAQWMLGLSAPLGVTTGDTSTGQFTGAADGNTPKISDLIAKDKPKEIVVALGDNMLAPKIEGAQRVMMTMSEGQEQYIRSFANQLPASTQCKWIGPTYHTPGSQYVKSNEVVDDFYKRAEAALGSKCKIVDARKSQVEGESGDGLHHSPAAQKKLAEFLKKEMQTPAAAPATRMADSVVPAARIQAR